MVHDSILAGLHKGLDLQVLLDRHEEQIISLTFLINLADRASRKRPIVGVKKRLRGQIPVSGLCRREELSTATYYKWSKDFLEAGRTGLTLSTRRDVTPEEVRQLKEKTTHIKKAVADLVFHYRHIPGPVSSSNNGGTVSLVVSDGF